MTPPRATANERLRRINALLDTALALPAPLREGWLAGLPAEDHALRATLRALLARAEVETDDFLRAPLALDDAEADVAADAPGERIGPYRLVQVLGRGGMSTVWLAEREGDGAQGEGDAGGLRRTVALKLPAPGLGVGLARRMARERDLLAALEHPRIARLYEAGVTPEGRPWLAMERVDGLPLDQYCQRHALGTEARLRLFLQVADAVAYAHARLVVHRDLKPANILVTPRGEVRLLDFGIATLLQDDAGTSGKLTRATGCANTPDYASPEQVAGRAVTVATDVYSLGVVLYELLTGRRPYVLTRHSLAALEEAILSADVPRPSANTGGDRKLARRLAGDLDTIVAKALRKPAARRYASVEAMAADVRRHLDGEPVLARPPSARYRLSKLLRRHWQAAAAGGAVLCSLATGLAVATLQWHEANRQRTSARQQLAQTRAALDFANAVLTEAIGNQESITRAELLQRSRRFIDRAATPLARAMGADHLSALYLSYGNHRDAEPLLSRVLAELPPDTDAALLDKLRCRQAHAWSQLGRRADAVRQLETVIAAGGDAMTSAYCLRVRAIVARNDNQAEAALGFATEALRRLDHVELEWPLSRALTQAEIAYARALMGQPVLADEAYAAAVSGHTAQGRDEAISAVAVINNWGIALLNSGRPLMALERFEQALAIARRRSPDGELPGYLQFNRANALRTLGRCGEALEAVAQLRAGFRRSGAPPVNEAYAQLVQASCLSTMQRHAQAHEAFDDASAAIAALAEPPAPSAPVRVAQQMVQVQLQLADRRWHEALAIADAVIAASAQAALRNSVPVLALVARAEARLETEGADAALQDAQAALALAQQLQQGLPHSSLAGQAWLAIGRAQQRAGNAALAREAFGQALRQLLPTAGAGHPQVLQAQQALQQLG